jgi:PAS domain S-box-containing protein
MALCFILCLVGVPYTALSLTVGPPIVLISTISVALILYRRIAHQKQQIADSRLQLQAVFDNMSEGVALLDSSGNLVELNPAASRLLGVPQRPLTRDTLHRYFELFSWNGDLVPDKQWPGSLALRGHFLDHQVFVILNRETGSRITAEVSTTAIRGSLHELLQIIVSYRDITEQVRHQQDRARLAAIVESSQDAIIGKDINGIISSWNASAEHIFGYTAAEMIGQSIMVLVPADRRDEELDFLRRLQLGDSIEHVETTRRRKDGKLIEVSLTISPIRDDEQRVIGASKMAKDITDRKRLERKLFQSQKMEAIGQLTGGIAHDFNNLLSIIIGTIGLLERGATSEEQSATLLRSAQKAAWRGAELIQRLLAFSNDQQLDPTAIAINDSVRNMTELAARAIGPEVRLTVSLKKSIPSVFVDAAGLESALLNLAVNARDAMPKGGSINITTEVIELDENYPMVKTDELKPGSYASVSVSDTGCGMSQEVIERVFEPFFTTKPRGKGTGLGLAMVYGFAKQSGGAVRIYSELGYGTCVTLYLPLADAIPEQSTALKAPPPRVAEAKTVLVVDDEPDLLEIACIYLTEMGHHPLQATDGTSALELVNRRQDIELVITDVIMPGGMDGLELVRTIRCTRPEVKVIYSSGFSADGLVERSGTSLDGLLLRKPYQRDAFNEMVLRAMEQEQST